jgi:diguanylate cyclase (GGDEF)-like protein
VSSTDIIETEAQAEAAPAPPEARFGLWHGEVSRPGQTGRRVLGPPVFVVVTIVHTIGGVVYAAVQPDFSRASLALLLVILAAASLVSCALVLVVAHRVLLRPLSRLSEGVRAAAQNAAQPDQVSIPLQGVEEIDAAAAGVNSLLTRMAVSMASLREHDAAERQRLATHDSLTGLPNRALFLRRLRDFIRAEASADRPTGIMLIGLDGFKNVNAAMGHRVGDRVLQEVARRISSEPRPRATLSRIKGDEFAALLPALADPNGASALARRLMTKLSEPFHVAGHEISLSASIGIALAPMDGNDADNLLAHATFAMDRAKLDGGNRIRYFSADLNRELTRQRMLESGLRRALRNNELLLHYQPKFDLPSGRLVGAEALLRWNHPDEGMLSPLEFIPLAERTGLIVPIGAWALNEACRQAQQWRRDGLNGFHMAVNLSAVQFRAPDILDTVSEALDGAGLPAEALELEITESMLIDQDKEAGATLAALSARGVQLSIDDFGTGYSSLSYLKRFPVNVIKIDRSFTADLPEKSDALAIVRAIIGLGHSLGLKVVAEGVETEDQLACLNLEGCDMAQGFLFARPLPESDFARRYIDTLEAVAAE